MNWIKLHVCHCGGNGANNCVCVKISETEIRDMFGKLYTVDELMSLNYMKALNNTEQGI